MAARAPATDAHPVIETRHGGAPPERRRQGKSIMSTNRIALAALAASLAFPAAGQAAPPSVDAGASLTAQAHVDSSQAARLAAEARRSGDRGSAAARRVSARAVAALARSRRNIEKAGVEVALTVATSSSEVAAQAAQTFSAALVRDARDLGRIARAQGAAGRAAATALGEDARLRVEITTALVARGVADASAAEAAGQAALTVHSDDLDAARVLAERMRNESDATMRRVLRRAVEVQLRARGTLDAAMRQLAEQGSAQVKAARDDVAQGTVVETQLMLDADPSGSAAAGTSGSAGGSGPVLGIGLSATVKAGVRS
jgi:hypothetical protein